MTAINTARLDKENQQLADLRARNPTELRVQKC